MQLNAAECDYALVHNAAELERLVDSDIDIVFNCDPKLIVAQMLSRIESEIQFELLNILFYEVEKGYYFIIAVAESDGQLSYLHLDCLYDKRGIHRYGLSTPFLLEGKRSVDGIYTVSPDKEFVYLCSKRIIKAKCDARQLMALKKLYSPTARAVAVEAMGEDIANDICQLILDSDDRISTESLIALRKRWQIKIRLLRPFKTLLWLLKDTQRKLIRLFKPTGLLVVLLGPDGCGKSTINRCLLEDNSRAFRSVAQFHWRPGLLPKLSSAPGNTSVQNDTAVAPPTRSHYTGTVSLLRYMYYWLDFVLGYWLVFYPKMAQTTLVVVERYAIDNLVNPERYGFAVAPWLMRFTSRFVPSPDLIIQLGGDAEEIYQRKKELNVQEIETLIGKYQAEVANWSGAVSLSLDTSKGLDATARAATQAIHDFCASRLSNGAVEDYRTFPPKGTPRLLVSSRSTPATALQMYNPASRRGQWVKAAIQRLPAPIGRVLLGRMNPVLGYKLYNMRPVIKQLQQQFGGECAIDVYVGSPGRDSKLTAQLSKGNDILAYAKLAMTDRAKQLLENEKEQLQMLGNYAFTTFSAPTYIAFDPNTSGVLVQTAPAAEMSPWPVGIDVIPMATCNELGAFSLNSESIEYLLGHWSNSAIPSSTSEAFRRELLERFAANPVICCYSHGDFVPWNAYQLPGNKMWLFDWEYAGNEYPALFDIYHFLFMQLWLVQQLSPVECCDRITLLIDSSQFIAFTNSIQLPAEVTSDYFLLYLYVLINRVGVPEGAYLEACFEKITGYGFKDRK